MSCVFPPLVVMVTFSIGHAMDVSQVIVHMHLVVVTALPCTTLLRFVFRSLYFVVRVRYVWKEMKLFLL